MAEDETRPEDGPDEPPEGDDFARGAFDGDADNPGGALNVDEARAAIAEALADEAEALLRESQAGDDVDLDPAEGGDEDDRDGGAGGGADGGLGGVGARSDTPDTFVDADPAALDAAAAIAAAAAAITAEAGHAAVVRRHLRGLLESLLFIADRPMKNADLAEIARADAKEVRVLLEALVEEYQRDGRGFLLHELAGGWQLRTSPTFAPFVRELTQQKPVRLTRAQVETLAIIAYRQPITRPEIEDIRGVDAGAVTKLLLDRDLVRVLGKKDEPGRPLIYGTTTNFLTFFGLKSLRDLPTLREFTELTEESREVVERELGDVLPEGPKEVVTKFGDASVAAADEDPTATVEQVPTQEERAGETQAETFGEGEDGGGGEAHDEEDGHSDGAANDGAGGTTDDDSATCEDDEDDEDDESDDDDRA